MVIKCVYCLQEKSVNAYKKREHVIPQCYGVFVPDNLILRKVVCDECNQYFGDNIELYLGRDTIEGIIRYKFGIEPRKQPQKHQRLKTRIQEGELKGMIVTHKPSEILGEIDLEPVIQAGFFNKETERYDYFEAEDDLTPYAVQLVS
jgi:hypothetical protein